MPPGMSRRAGVMCVSWVSAAAAAAALEEEEGAKAGRGWAGVAVWGLWSLETHGQLRVGCDVTISPPTPPPPPTPPFDRRFGRRLRRAGSRVATQGGLCGAPPRVEYSGVLGALLVALPSSLDYGKR